MTDREPVVDQTEHFLQCLRTGQRPLVGIPEGLEALRVVSSIQELLYERAKGVQVLAV